MGKQNETNRLHTTLTKSDKNDEFHPSDECYFVSIALEQTSIEKRKSKKQRRTL